MRIPTALAGLSLIAFALIAVPGSAGDQTIVLNATSGSQWLPSAPITIAPGDTITFVVFNNDTSAHTFAVSGTSIDAALPVGGNTNQNATFASAGTQYVYCGIPGHATDSNGDGVKDTGMVVRINVVAPGGNGGKTPGPEVLLLALVVLGVVAVLRFGRRTR